MDSIPGKIENGQLILNKRSSYIFKEKNEGKHVELRVVKRERSTSQLAMYRAWLKEAANNTGNDTEELHEFLLEKLSPRVVVTIHGHKGDYQITRYKRTSGGHSLSMNKTEMSEFMEKAAILTDFPLPTPEEIKAMGYLPN